jgi:hypothetical protein
MKERSRCGLAKFFAIMALSDARAWKDNRLTFEGDTGVTFKFIFFCLVVTVVLVVLRIVTGHALPPVPKKFQLFALLGLGVILLIANIVVNSVAKTLRVAIESEMATLAILPRREWLRIKWTTIFLFIVGECGFLFVLVGSFVY